MSKAGTRTRGATWWVKSNLDRVKDLPEPGDEWRIRDVTLGQQQVKTVRDMGIIECVGRETFTDSSRPRTIKVYETTQLGHSLLEKYRKEREQSDGFLPCAEDGCPANGFVSRSGGIECKRCGTVHDRGDVEV